MAAQGKAEQDLADLFHGGMEVQVLVSQGGGGRITVGDRGATAYTDGLETWKSFRIPAHANTEPVDNDSKMLFNLDDHVEGIGMTGWDWKARRSRWFGYDFDAVIGHSERHQKKLTEVELLKVQEAVQALPWVTVRKSTSGKGLHLYVTLDGDGIETQTHTEHAALARAILGHMSGQVGVDLMQDVDACGMVLWQWHTKYRESKDGLKLIRQGEKLDIRRVPSNWKDHAPVVRRQTNRVVPKFAGPDAEQAATRSERVPLDRDHKKLMEWLFQNDRGGYWCHDLGLLICHVSDMADAALDPALGIRGKFTTLSEGNDRASPNCYAIPLKDGAWVVRRYGSGTVEDKLWTKDNKGVSKAFFNRALTLYDAARLGDAAETTDGGYYFAQAVQAEKALPLVGLKPNIPEWAHGRECRVLDRAGRIVISIKGDKNDPQMKDYVLERGQFRRIMSYNPDVEEEEDNSLDFEDNIRHLTSEAGGDLGWVVRDGIGGWREEPLSNVKMFLASKGVARTDIDVILGRYVSRPWKIVNKPFQPEYGLEREWNRSTAGFKVVPTLAGELTSHPTWDKLFQHSGEGLDEAIKDHPWCKANGVTSGAHYLRLWFACLFRHSKQPLPFLAFHGPQDSGKSMLHEAVSQLLLSGGVMDGEVALTNQQSFNGELKDAILVTLEEVNLRNRDVIQRMKSLVTSPYLLMHPKGHTPVRIPNYLHFIQCVNDREFIPLSEGDTRLTVCYVQALAEGQKIPKRDLIAMLEKEAADFLSTLINMEIPDSKDRLMLPVIETDDKKAAEYDSMSLVQKFFDTELHAVPGSYVNIGTAHARFLEWAEKQGERADDIGQPKFSKEAPRHFLQGRITESGNQQMNFGNCSFDKNTPPTEPFRQHKLYLRKGKS